MHKEVKLNREEVSDWLNSPITQRYFKRLKLEAIERRELAAYGHLKKDTAYETGEQYIKAMIQAEVYEACAEPTVEDILTAEELYGN